MPDITVAFAARVIDAVRTIAAEEILPRYRGVAGTRKDDGSLVTEADLAAQRALVKRLGALEAAPVLGEEMPEGEQRAILDRGGRMWCVDPLDGTQNFTRSIAFFAVSVALMEDARPVFGVVHDPVAGESFHAVRGAGAWLDHKALRVPAFAPRLAGAIAEVSLRRDATASLRGALKSHPPYARRLTSGSSALSWCHLAAARVDAMVHSGQKVWDYAAGALVLEEAGGSLCAIEDDDFWAAPVWRRSAIAARDAALFAEWRAWIRGRLAAPGTS
ncbi:MAG TPA: inositol monophosphatase family protein [Usitatibacter sp.]|nr:inositol monophosphatase family protein [Usitatibacter sp.]